MRLSEVCDAGQPRRALIGCTGRLALRYALDGSNVVGVSEWVGRGRSRSLSRRCGMRLGSSALSVCIPRAVFVADMELVSRDIKCQAPSQKGSCRRIFTTTTRLRAAAPQPYLYCILDPLLLVTDAFSAQARSPKQGRLC